MNPQLIEMLGLGKANAGLEDQLSKQKMMSTMLGGMKPQSRQTRIGPVAPTPLEALTGMGASIMQGKGMKDTQGIMGQRTSNNNQQLQLLMQLLQQQQSPQTPQPAGPGMMPPQG